MAIFLLLCFTACSFNLHTHIKSEWKYNNNEHWKIQECDEDNCRINDEIYDFGVHVDDDNDSLCDVCSYLINNEGEDTSFNDESNIPSINDNDDTSATDEDDVILENNILKEAIFEKKQYFNEGITINYWLYSPANATENMPLIVYLHGGSGKGDDLELITDVDGFPQYLRDGKINPNAYVIIPQVSSSYKGWGEMKSDVMKLISFVRNEYKIDENRISLTGHSMGGTGVWMIALAYPNTFSAIAPLSGSVNLTDTNIENLKNVSVWAIVGSEDKIVDPQSSIDFIAELEKVNDKAKLTELDRADHFAVPNMSYLSNDFKLIDWLINQSK